MALEYLLVTFPDKKSVQADDNDVGFTNHTILLPADTYTITVDNGKCVPGNREITLIGTSSAKPMEIAFDRPQTFDRIG
jgi:hypothetical protein